MCPLVTKTRARRDFCQSPKEILSMSADLRTQSLTLKAPI
jgi:hypothetical protein